MDVGNYAPLGINRGFGAGCVQRMSAAVVLSRTGLGVLKECTAHRRMTFPNSFPLLLRRRERSGLCRQGRRSTLSRLGSALFQAHEVDGVEAGDKGDLSLIIVE
jgi:hypothetical protein